MWNWVKDKFSEMGKKKKNLYIEVYEDHSTHLHSTKKLASISFCGYGQENTVLKKAWKWMWHSVSTFSKEHLL